MAFITTTPPLLTPILTPRFQTPSRPSFLPNLPKRHHYHHHHHLHHQTNLPQINPRPTRTTPKSYQPLQTGYGQSTASDTSTAVKQAIDKALQTVPTPAVALITAPVTRDIEALYATAERHIPGVAIHGATTCAAPLTNEGSLPDGVSVLMLGGGGVIAAGAEGTDGFDVGVRAATLLADRMNGAHDVKHVIMQATPGMEEDVLRGMASVLKAPVFGGSAADDTVEGNWRIFTSDGGVFHSGVALVGIGPTVAYGACLYPPYESGRLSAAVTKAEGRTIFELDGRKAADVLGEWVGDSIDTQVKEGGSVIVECAGFPLGVERGGAWVALHAAEIGKDGSVGLFAEVAIGEKLVAMDKIGEGDSVLAAKMGLEKAYEEAIRKGGLAKPTAGLMVYCGGLSIAVGDRLNESLEGMKGKVPMLGMTVFGEQGQLGEGSLHSNLAVGVALFESERLVL